jgi:hypothetical protein
MTSLAFRRPTVLPIHRQGWLRPAGLIDFRVTQRFDVPDSFYGGKQDHNAVDLGNFRCGDAVVAMAPGTARRVQDNATALGAKTNALGLVIDHGSGITSEYWHLNGYSVASGAKVAAGQQIAIVGRTGLGDVCHLHVEVKRNGVRIDPEPLMFGTPLIIEEDDDVIIPPALVRTPNRVGTIEASATRKVNVRIGPAQTDRLLHTLASPKSFMSLGYADRADGRWYLAFYTPVSEAEGQEFGWVHSALSSALRADEPTADCSAAEAALSVARTKISRSLTAAKGAKQAIDVAVEALS